MVESYPRLQSGTLAWPRSPWLEKIQDLLHIQAIGIHELKRKVSQFLWRGLFSAPGSFDQIKTQRTQGTDGTSLSNQITKKFQFPLRKNRDVWHLNASVISE
jgi:hypothetical protein